MTTVINMRDAHPPERRFSPSSSVSLPQSPSPMEFSLTLLTLITDAALFAYGWNSAASLAAKQNCIFCVSNLGHNKPTHCRWLRMQTVTGPVVPTLHFDRSSFNNNKIEHVCLNIKPNLETITTEWSQSLNPN